jgi:hypothetical protein
MGNLLKKQLQREKMCESLTLRRIAGGHFIKMENKCTWL